VLGRSFDLTLVQATAGRSDEETVDALDELVGRGLIVETQRTGDPTYDFTHEKIRSLVYEETSLARRRLLHGRAADLLTSRRARFRPGDLALAAYHAENAGRVEDAAALHLDAGERARELFANAEALAHFQRALALGHPDAALVHEAIGDMEVLLGRYEAAVRSFETAAAYAAPDPVPDLERKLADVRVRTGDDAEARRHLERALNLVALEDPLRPELLADASHAWSATDPERAAALAKEAVDAGTRLGATGAVARARNQLGLLARRAGDLQAATTHLRHSLEAAEADGEIHSTVAALNNLALVHRQSGELAEAVELTKRALELCTRRGDVHRQAALHNNLADLMHALGDEEASQEHARAAARLFASVGDEPVTPPAIWRLTAW
jgi:tetratricopeptide (TPR) repeat protein